MANELNQGVHPFTIEWWNRLPAVYRRADRAQGYRLSEAWHGLNRDPRFITGWDGWHRANMSTKPWEASVGFTRTFRSTPHVPVYIRTWHNPVVVESGSETQAVLGEAELGTMVLGDTGEQTRVRHTIRNYTGDIIANESVSLTSGTRTTHMTTVTPDRFGVVQVTVQVTIAVPDARNLVEAIHVGTQDTTYEELPNTDNFATAAAYPLLRYMDGIGHQAGYISDMVDRMYDGSYTDPVTAPESSLPFLAAILGLPLRYTRSLTPPVLRSHLVALVEGRRPTPGSVAHIVLTAQQWLTGTRSVSVVPAHTIPSFTGNDPLHTLVIYAKATEVPNNDLAAFAQFLNDAGVIPAGHRVITMEATQSWDAWDTAYGTDWASKETNVKTWNQHDAAGVVLDYTEGA